MNATSQDSVGQTNPRLEVPENRPPFHPRPQEWYVLPGLLIGAGWLLSRAITPYASDRQRALALAALAVAAVALVVLAGRVHRAGHLLTRGTALLAVLGLGLTAVSVVDQLDRRIDTALICRQASAPISSLSDLTRVQRGTIGEYLEAGAGYRPVGRQSERLYADAAALGVEAFLRAGAVRARVSSLTEPQEQRLLRQRQAALAATCG